MTEVESLQQENKALKREVLQERIRRLSAERQAGSASLAAIQMRMPMIEQELSFCQAKLAELTKEADSGESGN